MTNLRKPTRIGAIDSGRRPQHSDAGLGGFLRFLEDPVNAGLTILWCLDPKQDIYVYIIVRAG